MRITFHNICIAIDAESACAAYNKLCSVLAAPASKMTTDTYSTDHNPEQRKTTELYPHE